jgi:hypothetical protein
MNEEMKRLIGVLNEAGYEVIEIGDMQYGGRDYQFSGAFCLKVADKSKDCTPSQP